jgi:hypothetical protein
MAPCEGEKNYSTPHTKSQEKIGKKNKKNFLPKSIAMLKNLCYHIKGGREGETKQINYV